MNYLQVVQEIVRIPGGSDLDRRRQTHPDKGGLAWSISKYGSAEELSLSAVDLPSPSGSEVLVEVEAVALNPLDLKLISGVMAQFMPVPFPFVPGSDVCGRIIAAGPDAKSFGVGDRVVTMAPRSGGMASHVMCDANGAMVEAPPEFDAADLAALPEAGMTAMAIFREADLQPGQSIAIIGATGGIGLLLCQMAARADADVLATAGESDGDLVRANGATSVLDYSRGETIAELLSRLPRGADVVVDLINQRDALLGSAKGVASGGRLISTLLGPDPSAFRGTDVRYIRLAPNADDLRELVDHLVSGEIKANVTQRFAFSDARNAYLALRDGHSKGKIVVHRDGAQPPVPRRVAS